MIFPFTIKIIVRMLYFLKKNLFKILLRSYKILCKILQDYETFLSHNLVRSYIRILTKILVKILNKIFCLGDAKYDNYTGRNSTIERGGSINSPHPPCLRACHSYIDANYSKLHCLHGGGGRIGTRLRSFIVIAGFHPCPESGCSNCIP